MTIIYSEAYQKSSDPDPDQQNEFARQAVLEEFRPRDGKALDYDGFVDRKPHEQPRPAPDAWRRETDKPRAGGWSGLARRRAA